MAGHELHGPPSVNSGACGPSHATTLDVIVVLAHPPRPIVVDRSMPEPLTTTELRAWMSEQTVFVSSVMADMTAERDAARTVVEGMGGRVSMFERLGGRDDDAETAYLVGVQSSDVYVGILGERYGKPEPSGYSPTHSEYNEAIRAGLRISVWATTGDMDGRQRDFLNEIRTFHTSGSYSSPDELREGLQRRLEELASAARSPWCKVGPVLFRARRYIDDGTRITVEALIRNNRVLSTLEGMRPDNQYPIRRSRITCVGRSQAVDIDAVVVEATPGRAWWVRVKATKNHKMYDKIVLLAVGLGRRSFDDLTELALRIPLLGEPNPLGLMAFMAKIRNPLFDLYQLRLDEDSFMGAAEVLLVDSLVSSGRVGRVTEFQIGPARSGRLLRLEWIPSSRFLNYQPTERRIEGNLHEPDSRT